MDCNPCNTPWVLIEALRRLHLKRTRPEGAGAASRSLLNEEGKEKLLALFERNNCSRANMDSIVAGMGGGLREEQISKELRTLGLKWGQLTQSQVRKRMGWWAINCAAH